MPRSIAIPADIRWYRSPTRIDDQTAAAVMMQGLTASHFATDFYPTQPGDIAFVHAAAGGVGLLLTQIVKLRGGQGHRARVVGPDKVAVAMAAGADHVIVDALTASSPRRRRLCPAVRACMWCSTARAPVTFQGIAGRRCAAAGTFCWYGPVLGGPGPLDIMSLPKSIKLGYAVFFDHIHTPELLRRHATQLFDWIAAGDLAVTIGATYPLRDAAIAHAAIESRASQGKLLLIP
jgi:NADPH2:quinone reductase